MLTHHGAHGKLKLFHLEDGGFNHQRDYKIIKKFKSSDDPEILIVVSKLLTGFDAPRNVVIYICKELKEPGLLHAIARANRLFEEKGKVKEYGYIIDYVGLSNKLKQAHQIYENYG
ncbi:MAG: hypothetical protein O7C60_02275 [Rickettsia endosymbiont of Ixodes persulcatus]|nr:hypothetical protein [Rickettsia endosymbiont of Ixodes persulcatus]MCZ6919238.1 hypothetical protein [Rickettsia endosymbiont of Ixodes persulcatus]